MKISRRDMIKNEYGGFDYPKNEWGEELTAFDLIDDTVEDCIYKIEQLTHYIRSNWSEPRGALSNILDTCTKLRGLTPAST